MTKAQITDHEVITFLTENQDFFIHHPEQLLALQVTNKNGKVASLINHQVNVLKQRNNDLKDKLAELLKFAADNEKIMSRVFTLALQICKISHVANVTKHFGRFAQQYFTTDLFKIVMPSYAGLESSTVVMSLDAGLATKFEKIFKDFREKDTPICGRLQKAKLQFIFADKAEDINSSVILPIGRNANKGLLIFASFDENRFNPEMSTDLLARLADILDKKFSKSFNSIYKSTKPKKT